MTFPESFPGSLIFYTVHQIQYIQDHTKPLSTFYYIISVRLHAPFLRYTDQLVPSNQKIFCRRTLFHYAGPCIEENTRKNRRSRAWYSFLNFLQSIREYLQEVPHLPVPAYNIPHGAIPTAILFHQGDRQFHFSK